MRTLESIPLYIIQPTIDSSINSRPPPPKNTKTNNSNLILLLIKIILGPHLIQYPPPLSSRSPTLPLLRIIIRQHHPFPIPALLRT